MLHSASGIIAVLNADPALKTRCFENGKYFIVIIEPAPDDSKIPQSMTVDYVRVYQKIPATGAGAK